MSQTNGTICVILDVDGTLIDSNYHHALAWYRAFQTVDATPSLWRIHRHMGMGGDQLVASVMDDAFEDEHGDDVRAAEKKLYQELIDEVVPLEGARDLIEALKERGHRTVLASSAKQSELDHYLEQLDVRDIVDAWTSSADVEATKPEPDLIEAAKNKVDADTYVLIGDSTWDCKAAARANVETIAVLTGGFCADELTEAGATAVFRSVQDLLEDLDNTPLA